VYNIFREGKWFFKAVPVIPDSDPIPRSRKFSDLSLSESTLAPTKVCSLARKSIPLRNG
jgi:hypothetical protein